MEGAVVTDTILYFQLSSPPRSVAAYAGLYWDEILTLAPPDYRPANPDAAELHQAGILRSIEAGAHVNQVSDIVTDVAEVLARRPQWVRANDELTAQNRLWADKLPRVVQQQLLDAGAAVPAQFGAYKVDPALLSTVVSVTARVVADDMTRAQPERRVSLFADRTFNYDSVIAATQLDAMASWRVDLGDYLPCPAPDVPMQKIRTLRERYADERVQLLAAIDRFAGALNASTSEPTAREVWQELQAASIDLKRAGHGLGVNLLVRGLTFAVTVAATMASAETSSPTMAAVMGAAAAVSTGVVAAGVRHRQPGDFAYLGRAQRLSA